MSRPWTEIPGFPGYGVSPSGRVYSFKSNWRGYGAREVTQDANASGYPSVRIYSEDGRRKRMTVHRLVMITLGPERPAGYECCHIDGDKTNNHIDNLRWGSKSDNARDRVRHGNQRGGVMEIGTRLETYRERHSA